jgi:hypothetical protein
MGPEWRGEVLDLLDVRVAVTAGAAPRRAAKGKVKGGKAA